MTNPWRGEVSLTVDGRRRDMRLSLGALASLEQALGETSLVDLVSRFEDGRFSAADLMLLLAAGLDMPREALASARIEGGPMAAAKAAAMLLRVTFALPEAPGDGTAP